MKNGLMRVLYNGYIRYNGYNGYNIKVETSKKLKKNKNVTISLLEAIINR